MNSADCIFIHLYLYVTTIVKEEEAIMVGREGDTDIGNVERMRRYVIK